MGDTAGREVPSASENWWAENGAPRVGAVTGDYGPTRISDPHKPVPDADKDHEPTSRPKTCPTGNGRKIWAITNVNIKNRSRAVHYKR